MLLNDPLSCLTATASARVPTAEGEFRLHLYDGPADGKEHLALVCGDVAGHENVLVRIHSECFTGDLLGSRRCDCGEQLHLAMHLIARKGRGVLIYLRQEGRGIGLAQKLRAYDLQDAGADTLDANLLLGHQADEREYGLAAAILQDLGVASVQLATNNPSKIEELCRHGINVTGRVPLQPAPDPENLDYLRTKMERMRHLLSLHPREPIPSEELALMERVTERLAEAPRFRARASRPFVTLSYAQSLDGSIALTAERRLMLSGPEAMRLTHALRAAHDAILIGIGTLIADDPRLTVRLAPGSDPRPVVTDSRLRCPLDATLLQNRRKPWIFTTERADARKQALLEEAGARVFRIPPDEEGRVDLKHVFRRLGAEGLNSVMLEGGGTMITSALNGQAADQAVITVAPILVGGVHAVAHLNGHGHPHLTRVVSARLGADIVLRGDLDWSAAS